MTTLLLFTALTSILAGRSGTAAKVEPSRWQPPPGVEQISLWPGLPPDSPPSANSEESYVEADNLVAGKPWHAVTNVSEPTMTIFSPPKEKNTGIAMVVFPGGGYRLLAIDLEGTEVCDWLTGIGITCALLKYRVPGSGCHWDPKKHKHVTPKAWTALQDAQRAIGILRRDAAKWDIDPAKIGVLGFSAGGNLVAMISGHFVKRQYAPVDTTDALSCRPDFAVALYPGHMSIAHKNIHRYGDTKLNPDIEFTEQSPPTLLVHAKDDKTDPVQYSRLYAEALRKRGVPVEMHLFDEGGHAFGLRPTDKAVTRWPSLVEQWLMKIGML